MMLVETMRPHAPVTAFIALGANVGDRERNILTAIEKIKQTPGLQVVRISTLMENAAQGMGPDAEPFFNAAAEIQTTMGSHVMLHRLLEIEREMGRLRRERWEPRMIDLDLLLYGDQIISSQELVVPHPLMHERKFVLAPLAEIAPNAVHPVLQMTVAGLLHNLTHRPGRLSDPAASSESSIQ